MDKKNREYQIGEIDLWGNQLLKKEWPLQLWKTPAGKYAVWLFLNDDEDGLHCIRDAREAADDIYDEVLRMVSPLTSRQ